MKKSRQSINMKTTNMLLGHKIISDKTPKFNEKTNVLRTSVLERSKECVARPSCFYIYIHIIPYSYQ